MQIRDFSAKRAYNCTAVASTTDAQMFQAADGSGDVSVYVPAGTKIFRVRAAGTFTTGTTCSCNPTIYFGDATTTALAAHAATAHNATSGGWLLEATCVLDTVKGKIHGSKRGWIGVTPTVLADTILTDVTCTTQALLNGKRLAIGCTYTSTDAANVATLDDFSIEVLALAK